MIPFALLFVSLWLSGLMHLCKSTFAGHCSHYELNCVFAFLDFLSPRDFFGVGIYFSLFPLVNSLVSSSSFFHRCVVEHACWSPILLQQFFWDITSALCLCIRVFMLTLVWPMYGLVVSHEHDTWWTFFRGFAYFSTCGLNLICFLVWNLKSWGKKCCFV